jgi:SNF2 family DNA or RNA helicase
MLHLAFTERALLADEMGLGKTVQAIAACALLRRLRGIERVLVVSPASLKGEWEEQIARFTDLPSRIIQGVRANRLRQYGDGNAFFHLVHYEQVLSDGEEIQRRLAPDVIILDEAQRIKNWQSRTAQAVKRLRSPYAFVLTGTPVENRIDEIYSIAQFLDPALLGPLFRFNRDFYELDERGRPVGYKNLDELHRRLVPVLLRRRKDEVEGQLPGRTDKHYFVPMDEEQAARYLDYEQKVAQLAAIARRRPLTPAELDKLQRWLSCMRMLCDTPYILDPDCRVCPKLGELDEILREVLAEPDAKALVFSEWERMLDLVRELAASLEIGFAWHTGSVPLTRRRAEIRRFKEDPDCRLFLSTDSGGVGLNLQAANVVINLDLPWNPARLEQRIARAWRKHQARPVRVINLVTEGSIEHRMIPLLSAKQALAGSVLDGQGDAMPLPSGRRALVERLEILTGPPEKDRTAPVPPLHEEIDPAVLATIEKLVAAGLLQITPEGRRRLQASASESDGERERRLARTREIFAQAERKIRMAAVLAGGGFPAEALPALREGVELGLRSAAHLEGVEIPEADAVSLAWIESHLPKALSLAQTLRVEPGTRDEEIRNWIAGGERLAAEMGRRVKESG